MESEIIVKLLEPFNGVGSKEFSEYLHGEMTPLFERIIDFLLDTSCHDILEKRRIYNQIDEVKTDIINKCYEMGISIEVPTSTK